MHKSLYQHLNEISESINGLHSRFSISNNNTSINIGGTNTSSQTVGDNCTYIGVTTTTRNASGRHNVGVGYNIFKSTTTALNNAGLGSEAFLSVTTGSNNAGIGREVLRALTSGSRNFAGGSGTLARITGSSDNTGAGYNVLNATTSGDKNSGFGSYTLASNTTGSANTGTGYSALYRNTTGSSNTADGRTALNANTTGSGNTGVGRNAGYNNQKGSNNCYFGYKAGENIVNSTNAEGNNICIGYNSGPSDANSNVSNTIYLGNNDITTIYAPVEISVTSDENLKTDITEVNGTRCLEIVDNLPVKRYRFIDGFKDNALDKYTFGFMAQDIIKFFKKSATVSTVFVKSLDENGNPIEVVTQNDEGDEEVQYAGSIVEAMHVNKDQLFPCLWAAVQEQNKLLKQQAETIKELTSQLEEVKKNIENL